MITVRRIVSREGPIDMNGRPMSITVNTWTFAVGGSYRRSVLGGIGFAYRHPSRVEVVGDKPVRPVHDYVLLVRFACVLTIALTLLIRRRRS